MLDGPECGSHRYWARGGGAGSAQLWGVIQE